MNPQIEIILAKYLSRSASAEELDILEKWIDTPEGKTRFQQLAKTNILINYTMSDPDTEQEIEQLLKRIRRAKSFGYRFRRTPYLKYAAAAVFVGILIAGYLIKERFDNTLDVDLRPVVVDNTISIGTDKAILTLEDGTTVALGEGTQFRSKNAVSNGEEIEYSKDGQGESEIVYNYLTVPRGGRFVLTLEDGTKVWLNSESKLKYPVKFKDSEARLVEFIYGEGYFDVSPSVDHQGSPFIVSHSEQTIVVLGTEFNLKAYPDENIISTTLVEGKVKLGYDGKTMDLRPNQQFRFNVQNKTMSLSEVNVFDVISWKEGVFSFDHATLGDIMKVLERWYDMEVIFDDVRLMDVKYNGTINKKFKIEDILDALMETKTIKTYEINQKTIVLK